ncbi:TPP1 [Symbiodinium natans]|uniref:subtilisin n=1 Tax=Symbiodinium natans TaxID=878477 RepID=A0A812NAX9_9DINO|nr:TPP1 [Symbiodinium natans]
MMPLAPMAPLRPSQTGRCWIFLTLVHVYVSARDAKRNFSVGLFLTPGPKRESALASLAAAVSDPTSPSYGHYVSQSELAAHIAVAPAASAAAAAWLPAALNVTTPAHVVAHGDATILTVSDFFATYDLGALLVGNRSDAAAPAGDLPLEANLLLTPPAPDRLCHNRTEAACRKPCRWHVSNHSKERNATNTTAKAACKGDFAGWICWRPASATRGKKKEPWQCFEPGDVLGVNDTKLGVSSLGRKRRRRGRARSFVDGLGSTGSKFRALPRSSGITLIYRPKNASHPKESWSSLELTLLQNDFPVNRLIQHEDFSAHHDVRLVDIPGLANLRPVREMFVCFNAAEYSSPAPGEKGCRCKVEHETKGRDERLGRECRKVWSTTPQRQESGGLLPRGIQSLQALYSDLEVDPEDGRGMRDSTQAVGQFNDEAFLEADVEHLHREYGLNPALRNEIKVEGVRGKVDNADTGGEGSLDLQVITSLAFGANTTWWGVDPHSMDGFMLAYAVQVNDHPEPPLVHSISWGDAEALYPPIFIQRLDYELLKLALRGITVIVASGDNGNSAVGTDCDFLPDLAGTSPWVTSVGATMPSLESKPYCTARSFQEQFGQCVEPGQVVCSTSEGALITSSGYFSIYRSRPSYQDRALEVFLSSSECLPCHVRNDSQHVDHLEIPCQHVNRSGCPLRPLVRRSRAAPDVALPGQSYPTVVNKSVLSFDGTSASAPALAALVSRLNEAQRRAGRPSLGLLNPWLYQVHRDHPEAFLDVVVGDTASTEDHLCKVGFRAGPGWDPTTGLGVPLFSRLRSLLPRPVPTTAEEPIQTWKAAGRLPRLTDPWSMFVLSSPILLAGVWLAARQRPRHRLRAPLLEDTSCEARDCHHPSC